jgi:hypothetical protein
LKENHDDIDADVGASVTLNGCWFSGNSSAEDGVTVVSTVEPGHGLAAVKIDVEGGVVRCAFTLMPVLTPLTNSGGNEVNLLLCRGVSVIRSLLRDHFAVSAIRQSTSDLPRTLHCPVGDDRCEWSSSAFIRCHSQQSAQWHGGGYAENDFSPFSHLTVSSTFPPIKAAS